GGAEGRPGAGGYSDREAEGQDPVSGQAPARPEATAMRENFTDPALATGNGAEQGAAQPPETPALYDRFTGQARRVVLLAHREAHRFGHDYVGTEHVLLGVLQENSGRGASLLPTFGLSVQTVPP